MAPKSESPFTPPSEDPLHPHRELREQAEEALRLDRNDLASTSPEDVPKLLYELRVHDVELEMQNEELRQAQGALAEACDHYAQLYDFSPAAYVTVTQDGIIEEVNLRFCAMMGVHRKAVLQQPFSDFVAPQDWDQLNRHRDAVVRLGTTQTCKLHLLPKEGPPVGVHMESVRMRGSGGRGVKLQTAMLDITERERAESLVQEREKQVQRTAAKLLTAQDEERGRIARDLHDDYCQRLTVVIMELARLLKARPAPWTAPAELLSPIKATLSGLLSDLRELSHELHPDRMASVALDEALRGILNDFREKMEASVVFHAPPRPVHLPAVVSICLYRVTQECLTNVLKHASAAHVSVTLTAQPDAVGLIIKDDGQGFVPEAVNGYHHLGLTSVHERVRQLKGTVTINSRRGAGTAVSIRIPLSQAESTAAQVPKSAA